MAKKGRKRIQSNFSLRDELITQPPGVMADDHPYSTHPQSEKYIHGNTNMDTRGRNHKESNYGLQDESITQPTRIIVDDHPYSTHVQSKKYIRGDSNMSTRGRKRKECNQPPTIVTTDDHCYNISHAQSDKQNYGNKNVAGKGQKYKTPYFNLQIERLTQPRIMTAEEHPHSAHAQFHMLNHRDTSAAGKDVINYRSNIRLMEDSGIQNVCMDGIGSYEQDHEHMDGIGSYEQDQEHIDGTGSYGQDHEQGLLQNDIVNRQPDNRLREEPIVHDVHMDGTYENEHEQEDGNCAMPCKNKTKMLDVVKVRFHVPIIAEKWIFGSIRHKWRNWKHFLKTRYWVANVPVEDLIDERDERVMIDQWVKLLTHWNSKKQQRKKVIKIRMLEQRGSWIKQLERHHLPKQGRYW